MPPITPELGHKLISWLDTGADPTEIRENERVAIIKELQARAASNPKLVALYKNLMPNKKTDELTKFEANSVLEQFNKLERGK